MATKKSSNTLTLSAIVDKYNTLASTLDGFKPVKKFRDKATALARLAEIEKAVTYSDTTGERADFNIDPLPKTERKEPKQGTLRDRAFQKMLDEGITPEEAIELCREFDAERGKPTNEDTVARRGYELLRLVAKQNGYGAKEKNGKIITAA